MKLHAFFQKLSLGAFVAVAVVAVALSAHAGLGLPYTPDAHTLHLWHLDDTNGLYTVDAVATSASASANAIPITLTNLGEPTPGTFPYTNTSLGNLSYDAGLGTCYTGTDKQHLLYGGSFPDVSQFCNPSSGAFTFEALAKSTRAE